MLDEAKRLLNLGFEQKSGPPLSLACSLKEPQDSKFAVWCWTAQTACWT